MCVCIKHCDIKIFSVIKFLFTGFTNYHLNNRCLFHFYSRHTLMCQIALHSKHFLISIIQADRSWVTKRYEIILYLERNRKVRIKICLVLGTMIKKAVYVLQVWESMTKKQRLGKQNIPGRQNMDEWFNASDVILLSFFYFFFFQV